VPQYYIISKLPNLFIIPPLILRFRNFSHKSYRAHKNTHFTFHSVFFQ